MKLILYALIFISIIIESCGQFPFFDSHNTYSYRALPELNDYYGCFIKNDSISIKASISVCKLEIKDRGVYSVTFKMSLIANNKTKADIELYTDSLKSICRSFDGQYIYHGVIKASKSPVILISYKEILFDVYLFFDIKCDRNYFLTQNEIEIQLPSLNNGNKLIVPSPIILRQSINH